jgi:hypothetical protein
MAAAVALLPRFRPEIDAEAFRIPLLAILFVIVGGGLAVWSIHRRRGPKSGATALLAATALFCLACSSAIPHLDTRSVKDLALTLKARLQPQDEVVNFLTYYQDLPVYLERRITLVDWRGELEFGTTVEDTSAWMIDSREFRKRWESGRRLYLVTTPAVRDWLRQETAGPYFLIARDKNNVILSNKEDTP